MSPSVLSHQLLMKQVDLRDGGERSLVRPDVGHYFTRIWGAEAREDLVLGLWRVIELISGRASNAASTCENWTQFHGTSKLNQKYNRNPAESRTAGARSAPRRRRPGDARATASERMREEGSESTHLL